MIGRVDEAALARIHVGAHVGWWVRDDDSFEALARDILKDAVLTGEKAMFFGPSTSPHLESMRGESIITADPSIDLLSNRVLDPERMYSSFREADKRAKAEGYNGLRVMADMDWILGTDANATDVISFELVLDRVIREIGATVICAYRSTSFDHEPASGVLAVHPVVCAAEAPPFRLIAENAQVWRVFGEIDLSCKDAFDVAIRRATQYSKCTLDISHLDFIDVAGMRILAKACSESSNEIELRGASESFRRLWSLVGCNQLFSLN